MLLAQNGIWPWLISKEDSDFPIFLRLGGFEIRWYAICIFLGMLLCLYRCRHELKKRGCPEDYYDNFFLSCMPIALVGSRLWYVISCFDEFKTGDFFTTLARCIGFQEGGGFALAGLAVQGGVLFGFFWGVIYYKFIHKRYTLGFHVDLIVPCIFIGQIMGRWGNFFNGEVYGKLVDRDTLWYIPEFIINNCTLASLGSQAGQQMVQVPLFFIEGCLNTIGYFLIGELIWKKWTGFKFKIKGKTIVYNRRPYCVGALYFIYYGVVRFLLEPLRIQEFQMGTSQQMSIFYIALGVGIIIAAHIFFKNVPYEKIYVNEVYEAAEKLKKDEEERLFQEQIEAKKQEIRERRKHEQENK